MNPLYLLLVIPWMLVGCMVVGLGNRYFGERAEAPFALALLWPAALVLIFLAILCDVGIALIDKVSDGR